MTLTKFLNLLSTVLGCIGSVLLIKAVLAMTPDVIAEISHTDLYYSKPVLQNLASQKADVITGAAVICIAFVIQFLNQFLELSALKVWSAIHPLILLAIVTIVVMAIAIPTHSMLKKRYESEGSKGIVRLLITKYLYKGGQVQPSIMDDLKSYANDLLSMPTKPGETDEDFLKRVSEYVGISNAK